VYFIITQIENKKHAMNNKLKLANEWQILITVEVGPYGTLRRDHADTIEESVVFTVGLS
jgi:hypothetical protein